MGASSSLMPVSNIDEAGQVVSQRDKRKKIAGFATLKKKFIRRRRSSKACDHARVIRDMVSDWSPFEVASLLEEYEALAALKDLSVQAELARPPAATYKQDLCSLYDYKCCTDIDLVFRGACFPVHRAILSVRCPYFRELLNGCPGHGARIGLELRTPSVDINTFSVLLRYLYTGDIRSDEGVNIDLLQQLGQEFGLPAPLERDLRTLLETGEYADAALVFTNGDGQRTEYSTSEYGFRPKVELPCHKAILSARSPFFRNIIERRSRAGEDQTERALNMLTRIVLDESVIPRRYARLLLHVVYLDTVDLGLILRGTCSSLMSLSDAPSLPRPVARLSALEEAMELYQIGRFLELDILAQGCEDLILEGLTLDSLPAVLRWGSQPHGSAWVKRQALHFLREEFQTMTGSPILFQLDKPFFIEALQSSFLQASELEILSAVLKWGEHRLMRRMEDREPNLLSHTAHSVTKKGIKKRDLSDTELREILSDLLPLVRMDHVIPANSDVLGQAIRRRLVSTPPSHMIGGDRESLRVNAWIRNGSNSGLYVRPRLFMPYYDEVKSRYEDQIVNQTDVARMRRSRCATEIPDTLYMVGESSRTMGLDVLAAALTVPQPTVMAAMVRREQKVRSSPCVQRALALPLSCRREINRHVRLRVVREFNMPDAVADLLENAACYYPEAEDVDTGASSSRSASAAAAYPSSTYPAPYNVRTGSMREHTYRSPLEGESSSCSDGHLSDVMPDVAMATAAMSTMQLGEPELELDLDLPFSHLLHIGYNLDEQRSWHKLHEDFKLCAFGVYQTPVPINFHRVEQLVMPALEFYGYQNFLTPPLALLNNAHTIKLSLGNYEANGIYRAPEVSGGFLTSTYVLESLHFHWGQANERGSEHIVDNISYPMEMHLVHRNKNYNTISEAIGHKDGLVVLGFFFHLRIADNQKYKAIIKTLRHVRKPHDSALLERSFSLSSLLPGRLDTFYTYEGSLTTPPCSEAVTWFLFPDTIPLSYRQMEIFRSILIQNNFRELQELGQRKIYLRQSSNFVDPNFQTYDRNNITKRSFWLY